MITAIDKNTALVLIDLQHGIMATPCVLDETTLINNTLKLITAFHQKKLPVVFVTVAPAGDWTQTRKEIPNANTVLADNFTELHPSLQPIPSDILIRKHNWSPFFGTTIHQQLQDLGITQIILGGIATSIGVEGCARDASVLGYNIGFATDAMSDRTLAAHEHSIKTIFPKIGQLGKTDDIITLLNQS